MVRVRVRDEGRMEDERLKRMEKDGKGWKG